MSFNSFRKLLPQKPSQIIFIGLLLIVLCLNIKKLIKEVDRIRYLKTFSPHQNIGHEFVGLKGFLIDVPYIGYYSDGDLKDDKNNKLYSVAQYVLSPTILDPLSLDHEYILFVCSNKEIARRKLEELNAEAILLSPTGMILGKRKP